MSEWLVRVALSVTLVGLAIYDLKRQRVPNAVVMPLLLVVFPLVGLRWAAGAMSLSQVGLMALTWSVCLFMQATRMLGGGDAKLAMALVGIFPEREMAYLLLVVFLVGHIIILLSRDGWAGVQRVKAMAFNTLVARQLPTPGEIRAVAQARRSPVTYLLSLAGLVYLWAR